MKQIITKLDERHVLKRFPIQYLVQGWFFRLEEASIDHFIAEGTDLWGRKVFREGGDEKEILRQCVQDAEDIQRQVTSRDA